MFEIPITIIITGAPSCLNSRPLGYVPIGYIEPRTRYLGNWSPRANFSHMKSLVLTALASEPCVEGAGFTWIRKVG